MNIDTVTVHCFLAVAETGSFTRAGVRVGRTQSAVSQQIAKLEGLLGKKLVERGRVLSLTISGETFLTYARQIYALHREALDRFREPELEGEVRFGLPEDFASVFLSDVLADFAHIHPRILLNIECDLTLNLYNRFRQNEFDLVLVKMNRPEDFPYGIDVLSETLVWVGDSNLIDHSKPIPLVLAPLPCVYRARAVKALDTLGRKWRLVLSSPSYAGTIAAVKANMGITVLPRAMIPPGLEVIRKQSLPNLSDIHVSLLKRKLHDPATNSLEDFVLRKLKS
jgi:DNA-binding transcriptional LysR family regulator